eukprot:365608-Chlamydomonas_euryale.AAC.15
MSCVCGVHVDHWDLSCKQHLFLVPAPLLCTSLCFISRNRHAPPCWALRSCCAHVAHMQGVIAAALSLQTPVQELFTYTQLWKLGPFIDDGLLHALVGMVACVGKDTIPITA